MGLESPGYRGFAGLHRRTKYSFVNEGLTRDGKRPDPPMPQFRLNRSDAEAVVAYLKSLR